MASNETTDNTSDCNEQQTQLQNYLQLLQLQLEYSRQFEEHMTKELRKKKIVHKIDCITKYISACYDSLFDELKWRCNQVLAIVDDYYLQCEHKIKKGGNIDKIELEKICKDEVDQGLEEIKKSIPDMDSLGIGKLLEVEKDVDLN